MVKNDLIQPSVEFVKVMVFAYALKKSNVDYPKFEKNTTPSIYLNNLKKITLKNLNTIDEKCDENFSELVKDCIVNFGKDFAEEFKNERSLMVLNEMSLEDIKDFLTSEIDFAERNKFDIVTPHSLRELTIKLLNKNNPHSWFDLGCGYGDFLIDVKKENLNNEVGGIDIDINNCLITRIRLYFLDKKYNIDAKNAILESYESKYDVGFANTPFLARFNKEQELEICNECNKFVGILKQSQSGEWAFADRLLQIIKDRGIIIMSEGRLLNTIDSSIREALVKRNLIEGIIKFPTNIFFYGSFSTSMIIFNKNKTNNEIKLLDATNMCKQERRIAKINVDEIVEAYNSDHLVTKISIDEELDGFRLNVGRYLAVEEKPSIINPIQLEKVVKEIFRGAQIPASIADELSNIKEEKETYKLLSVGDIQNGYYDINSLQKVENNGQFDRYLIHAGDVLVSSKSTKIKTAVAMIPENEKVVATGSILVIRCKKEQINPVYLKAFFDSENGSNALRSIQTGTVIISINASALMKIRIPLLEKEKQNEIADRYLTKLNEFKIAKEKLQKIEDELNKIFDDSTNNTND